MAGRAGCRPHCAPCGRYLAGAHPTLCVPGACQPLRLECASRMVSATPHTYATGAAATAAIIVPCQPPRPAASFAPPTLRPHSRCSCLHSAAPCARAAFLFNIPTLYYICKSMKWQDFGKINKDKFVAAAESGRQPCGLPMDSMRWARAGEL